MLAKRIIPCLDVDRGRVVKGTGFVDIRDAGDPVELACRYYEEGADELCFLDITASHEERKATYSIIEKTAKQVFIPLTVGGGVSSVEDAARLLQAGADKVSINSSAVRNPALISEISKNFGAQCTVIAVDVKKFLRAEFTDKHKLAFDNKDLYANVLIDPRESKEEVLWELYIKGGREATGIDALKWIEQAYNLGAGEILLTSMDADGSKQGYDLEITRKASQSVNIPVIASGGAGCLDHIIEAFKAGADAALLASLLHYGELSIAEIKKTMQLNNIETRHLPMPSF
jgi:cyclase